MKADRVEPSTGTGRSTLRRSHLPSGGGVLGLVGTTLAALTLVGVVPTVAQEDQDARVGNPYFERGAVEGSGVGKKIGYIALHDGIPFVSLVSHSIREQAAIAGVELIACDAQADFDEGLACAHQLGLAGVQGVLNFQTYEEGAPEVCDAYGGVPTIAIDIHQRPCEVAFMGADNRLAGRVTGETVGEHMQQVNGCVYDMLIVLEASGPGSVVAERTTGALDGFASVCGAVPNEKLRRIEAASADPAQEAVTDLLGTLPRDGTYVVMAINDDGAVGALAAFRAASREDELWVGSQGADPISWPEIACNPQWIADAAYFPERYGHTLIPAMIDILDGKDVPAELFTPHIAVTRENVRELYPETPECP